MIKRATFSFLFVLLFTVPQPAFVGEWYEGGTLHTATVSRFQQIIKPKGGYKCGAY